MTCFFFFKGAAATCEMNLMKTLKYGGRKTPPSKEELNQLVVSVTRTIAYLLGKYTADSEILKRSR